MRLSITLPQGWSDLENPEGPPTYVRNTSEVSGAFQVSWAEYRAGLAPGPSAETLRSMSEDFGRDKQLGRLFESEAGNCAFGRFGTAVFLGDEDEELLRAQIWTISDGLNFIRATHLCCGAVDPQEVREAAIIAKSLILQK